METKAVRVAWRRLKAHTGEKLNLRMDVAASGCQVTLTAQTDGNEVSMSLDAERHASSGDAARRVGVNGGYLDDVMNWAELAGATRVLMSLGEFDLDPLLFAVDEDEHAQSVLMPTRL